MGLSIPFPARIVLEASSPSLLVSWVEGRAQGAEQEKHKAGAFWYLINTPACKISLPSAFRVHIDHQPVFAVTLVSYPGLNNNSMRSNTSQSFRNSGSISWRGTRIVPKVCRSLPNPQGHAANIVVSLKSPHNSQAYNKSERLGLEFWDPRRLASHVLATLLPADRRAELVRFILDMKLTGSFLQRYTHQIEE